MEQPLFATPAEKSWMEDVSWAPVRRLSLSYQHFIIFPEYIFLFPLEHVIVVKIPWSTFFFSLCPSMIVIY